MKARTAGDIHPPHGIRRPYFRRSGLPCPGFNGQAKGVSVDIDGYIWVAFQNDTHAYRIDPNTYAIETVSGLNDPYTYSDMTGGQLANVNCNPPEG
jgi:hypothetical protein